MKRLDLAVLGSGAGLKVALAAARRGWRTALFESGPAGGTCLNRGCIPSKMLIAPAALAERVREAASIDLRVEGRVALALDPLVARTARETAAIAAGIRQRAADTPNLTWVEARARFTGPRELEAGGDRFQADRVLIAVGSEPAIPAIPGLSATPFMTSEAFLKNRRLPRRLAVLGAGYIAAELGHLYGVLGAEVTFLVRSRFLRHEDPDVSAAVESAFTARHRVLKGVRPVAVAHGPDGFAIACETDGGRETVRADAFLVAAGIQPSTAGLQLEAAGVACDGRGFIQVDDRLRASADGVWALGDVIGRYAFRHTANSEAEYLERTLVAGREEGPLAYGPVPHAIFTRPEVAGVGLTEPEARAAGLDLVVARAAYADATNAGLARGLEEGFVKILADRATGRLVGAHAVGEEAATLVHLFIALMLKGGTLGDLRRMIFIHPALPELVRDAVRSLPPDEVRG